MRTAKLTRNETGDAGTFGTLITDSGFKCRTGELPWRDNFPGKSCIPVGIYLCHWRRSPTFGFCYHVDGVEGRNDIEIHPANFMGDSDRGLRCQLLGCIAPGLKVGSLNDQKAIISSAFALKKLEEEFDGDPFQLTIETES